MEFVQIDDPFLPDEAPIWPSVAELGHLVAACAARPGGHAWTIAGDSGVPPWLACADCPASSDDLMPDLLDELGGEQYEVGGRTILFGEYLPDADDSVFVIPVNVRIETIRHQACDYGGYEYDVAVHITDREMAV